MTPLFLITSAQDIRLRKHGEPVGQEDGRPSG
jgi:hypothetical protein